MYLLSAKEHLQRPYSNGRKRQELRRKRKECGFGLVREGVRIRNNGGKEGGFWRGI